MKRMNIISGIFTILAMAVVTTGCNDFELKATPGFAADATSKEAAKIILQKCTGCHANGKSENGFGYVDKPLQMMKNGYIKAGDHAASLIYKKMSATPPYGDRMPKGGPYLTEYQLATIATWIDNLEDPYATKYTVSISASTGITTNPTGSASVSFNKTLEITVAGAEAFDRLSVGGTCAEGTLTGSTYTTGKVTADCTVDFVGVKASQAVITASSLVTGAVTIAQSSITLEKGQTYTFTNLAARTNDTLNKTQSGVTGTCPQGSWTGNDYTTGTITADCSVIFATDNPCPTALGSTLQFADVQPIFDTPASGQPCVTCHEDNNETSGTGKAGFDGGSGVFALSEVLNKPAVINTPMILVKPMYPFESLIYLKIQEDGNKRPGDRMPWGGAVTLADQGKVCNWILQGANP